MSLKILLKFHNHMRRVLHEIVTDTERALVQRRSEKQLDDLRTKAKKKESNFFYDAILNAKIPAVIAEIKMKSPSHGTFDEKLSLKERVELYISAGVQAISYVTNETFFGGKPKIVKKIKQLTNIPILQKDFVIDEYQIYEAAINGADALLLISRIIDTSNLVRFVDLCLQYGIEPIVEAYDEADIAKALESSVRIIGVNARDLDTLAMDRVKACDIIKKIPSERIALGFSGISSKMDVNSYIDAGARGVLIGSGFMKAENINEFMRSLI